MKAWSWKPPGEPSFPASRAPAPLRATPRHSGHDRPGPFGRTMKIAIITPGSEPFLQGLVTGNEVTARRWEEVLRKLGHDPVVLEQYGNEEADLLIALHARKSSASIEAFKESFPAKPLVVAMTGTDLYQDLPDDETVLRSLEIATHIVVLQPGWARYSQRIAPPEDDSDLSIRASRSCARSRKRPIVSRPASWRIFAMSRTRCSRPKPRPCSESVRVQVVHAGAAGFSEMEKRAKDAATKNARYRWIGPVPHEEARLLIARSHILLLTSHSEGGATCSPKPSRSAPPSSQAGCQASKVC